MNVVKPALGERRFANGESVTIFAVYDDPRSHAFDKAGRKP